MCVCICIDIDIWISEYMNYQIIIWYFNKSILTYVSFLYSFLCPRSNHFQISWFIFVSLHIFEQYSYISRVPWTARRSNQSIRKEISPGCSLEGLMLKLWPPDVKSWLIGKDPDAGKDWGQEEKGRTEDKMVGWHRWLNGHGFGWTLGVGDGQGGLVCCTSWGHKELDTTEPLNWTELIFNL